MPDTKRKPGGRPESKREKEARKRRNILAGVGMTIAGLVVAGIIASQSGDNAEAQTYPQVEYAEVEEGALTTNYGEMNFSFDTTSPSIMIAKEVSDSIMQMVADELTEEGIEPADVLNNIDFDFATGVGGNAMNTPNLAPNNAEEVNDMTVTFNTHELFLAQPLFFVRLLEPNPQAELLQFFEGYEMYGLTIDTIREYGPGRVNAAIINMAYAQEIAEGGYQRGLAISGDYDGLGAIEEFEGNTDNWSLELSKRVFQMTLEGKMGPVFTLADGGVINSEGIENFLIQGSPNLSRAQIQQYVEENIERFDINKN